MELYSLKDISNILDLSPSSALAYANRVTVPRLREGGGMKFELTIEEVREVALLSERINNFEDFLKNGTKESEKKGKLTLEEMKELHPLVKDERFFKQSFFPDIDLEAVCSGS